MTNDTTPTPDVYSPLLQGCRFEFDQKRSIWLVMDSGDVLRGLGVKPRSAAVLAARAMQSNQMSPQAFHPSLVGCSFSLAAQAHQVAHQGANPGMPNVVVRSAEGSLLASASSKLEASSQAVRRVLAEKEPHTLEFADFARLCTVMTVTPARGKTGTAQRGQLYLRPDHSSAHTGMSDLRLALKRGVAWAAQAGTAVSEADADAVHKRGPGLMARAGELLRNMAGAPERRSDWLEQSIQTLLIELAPELEDASIFAHRLGHGEWLIVRRLDAPPAKRCVQMVLEDLASQAQLSQDKGRPSSPSSSSPKAAQPAGPVVEQAAPAATNPFSPFERPRQQA